jgi:hypothetical protein
MQKRRYEREANNGKEELLFEGGHLERGKEQARTEVEAQQTLEASVCGRFARLEC